METLLREGLCGVVPPALNPAGTHLVVSCDLTIVQWPGMWLTAGDFITRLMTRPMLARKSPPVLRPARRALDGGERAPISVENLQDMQNHFQEQLDSGMKELAEKPGTSGLPRAPDGITAADVTLLPPGTSATKELSGQEEAADETKPRSKRRPQGLGVKR